MPLAAGTRLGQYDIVSAIGAGGIARRPGHRHKRTVLDVRLPGPSVRDQFAISSDGRTVHCGASRVESDIWMVERR